MTKLLKLSFAFSLLILVFSCGKDDDPVAARGDIEGTWTATGMVANVETNSSGNTSTVDVTGSNFDYDLTFTADAFSTEGSYTGTNVISSGGFNQTQVVEYTDIMGSGTYTIDGNVITTMGSFFDFDASGMGSSGNSEPQNAQFSIDGDVLTMTQNETTTSTFNGQTSTSVIVGTYTFRKK